jgi:hypothetical protein
MRKNFFNLALSPQYPPDETNSKIQSLTSAFPALSQIACREHLAPSEKKPEGTFFGTGLTAELTAEAVNTEGHHWTHLDKNAASHARHTASQGRSKVSNMRKKS